MSTISSNESISGRSRCGKRATDSGVAVRYGGEIKRKPTQRQHQHPSLIIRQHITEESQQLIRDFAPEYEIHFQAAGVNDHAIAAAFRHLETEILIEKLGCGITGDKVIDVGGGYASHICAGRTNIHSCAPLLDLRDHQREVHRQHRLRVFYSRNMANARPMRAFDAYKRNPNDFFCHNLSQDCTYPASAGMAVHSIYDIDFDDVAKIMAAHDMKILVGTFIFSPMILIQDRGVIDQLRASYVIDRTIDSITFGFVGDSSTLYEHKFSQYLMYVTRHTIAYKDRMYLYELSLER